MMSVSGHRLMLVSASFYAAYRREMMKQPYTKLLMLVSEQRIPIGRYLG